MAVWYTCTQLYINTLNLTDFSSIYTYIHNRKFSPKIKIHAYVSKKKTIPFSQHTHKAQHPTRKIVCTNKSLLCCVSIYRQWKTPLSRVYITPTHLHWKYMSPWTTLLNLMYILYGSLVQGLKFVQLHTVFRSCCTCFSLFSIL